MPAANKLFNDDYLEIRTKTSLNETYVSSITFENRVNWGQGRSIPVID